MYSVKEAESIILTQIQPQKQTEKVSLEAAFGRILAEDISSDLDFPYWDNSAMDGYAVRYEDVKDTNPENPVTLKIIAEIPAGKVPEKIIQPGETARIFTGAMLNGVPLHTVCACAAVIDGCGFTSTDTVNVAP